MREVIHTSTGSNSSIETTGTNKTFILLVSLVAALGGLLFGYDTAIISGTIPFIKTYFNMDEYHLGWAVSSILIGCALGAIVAGRLAENLGRRYVLIFCAILFAVSGIGAGLSQSLSMFIIYRVIGGLGVGAAAMVSPMYIAEMAPPASRGRLVSIYQLAIVSGILLAYFTNYALLNTGSNNWRWMFASQVIPAVVFFLLLLLVPETPRWLVKKGRIKDAERILKKIAGENEIEDILKDIDQSFLKDKVSRVSHLFSGRNLPILWIGVLIATFQQITGINSVLYYAPVILVETGVSTEGSLFQTMGIGIITVLATILAIGLVDRIGRRWLLISGSLAMGISLIAIGLCFQAGYFKGYTILLALLVYVASFSATWGAVAWVYLSEIFPNRIRALALSAATLVLWIADFIVTYTFPIMRAEMGTSGIFFIYAFFCIIALVFVVKKVPETKGRSLEEIEKSFAVV